MKMHAAKLATSSRLRRVHAFMLDGDWHSTWEIMTACRTVNTSTAISELRANGAAIECRRFPDHETSEAHIFKYRMTRPVAPPIDSEPRGAGRIDDWGDRQSAHLFNNKMEDNNG
jgi:hypothetical protein